MRVRAVIAITCVLTLAGCKLNTDYFSDYRGKNLLSNWNFNATDTSANPKWALEPYSAYQTGGATPVAGYATSDYMNWAQAGDLSGVGDGTVSTLSVGPDGISPAYRLEIKNLFNDGDFENAAAGPIAASDTWWSPNSNATAVVGNSTFTSAFSGTYLPISSQSLFFSAAASSNTLAVTLNSFSVPLWSRPGNYQFRFDYRYTGETGTFHAMIAPTTNAENNGVWDMTGLTSQSSNIVAFSRQFTKDNTSTLRTVTLGSSAGFEDEAVIDNVRVVQNDIPPYVTMAFPSLSSGSAALLPGSKSGDYKLTFWVHDDPTADQTNALHATNRNRLEPPGITVQVTAAVKSGSGTYVSFIPRPASGWATWTQLTFSMGFDFVNADSAIPSGTSALKIEIGPTNTVDETTSGRDVGSTLIAQPSLTFNP